MKKLILLFVMCIVAWSVDAQIVDFNLQSNGKFINKSDKKNFVVIPFENKTSNELYNDVLKAITKIYNSPKDVISKVDGDIISINGISENFTYLTGKVVFGIKTTVFFSIQYVLQFQFKDGKIRIDAPIIVRFFTDTNPDISPFSGWLSTQRIFNGENPVKKDIVNDFNNSMNKAINNILFEISNKEEW